MPSHWSCQRRTSRWPSFSRSRSAPESRRPLAPATFSPSPGTARRSCSGRRERRSAPWRRARPTASLRQAPRQTSYAWVIPSEEKRCQPRHRQQREECQCNNPEDQPLALEDDWLNAHSTWFAGLRPQVQVPERQAQEKQRRGQEPGPQRLQRSHVGDPCATYAQRQQYQRPDATYRRADRRQHASNQRTLDPQHCHHRG
mmetsp:Transcript_12856/g.30125  ORF Transcript_12856/g.30125 Transcript_12856/m.30125 type:complete len:200 (-) Transcript_12856:4318-4917(-)